jgi:hypothetical protein
LPGRCGWPAWAVALAFPVGYATVGLVLSRRRPANPIGWLYAASGLAWVLNLPFGPWLDQLVRDHWPLPLAAQLAIVAGGFVWAPAVAFGLTLPTENHQFPMPCGPTMDRATR